MKTTDEREHELAELRKLLSPGDTVHTILRHVSRSGMSRRIDVVLIRNNETLMLTHACHVVLEYPYPRNGEGLRVDGCGSDMGFEVVYNLGRVLFPEGFKVKGIGRNGDKSGWDNDGGYALKQRWL